MKIWFQTAAPIGKNPTFDSYEKLFVKHAKKVARQDTEIRFSGPDIEVPRVDSSYYLEYINAGQILNNAVLAEKEGFDAFAVTCMRSPVFIEIQEIVDIPVVYTKECALTFSLMFAKKFAFISFSDGSLIRRMDEARRIVFADRLLPGGNIGISMEQLNRAFDSSGPVLKKVEDVSRKAIKEGAELLIPGCCGLSVLLVERGLRDVDGVPILDNVAVLVKMAEMVVDLKKAGICRTRSGLFPSVSAEERTKVRRLFSLE
jgi:allantoin racemase